MCWVALTEDEEASDESSPELQSCGLNLTAGPQRLMTQQALPAEDFNPPSFHLAALLCRFTGGQRQTGSHSLPLGANQPRGQRDLALFFPLYVHVSMEEW